MPRGIAIDWVAGNVYWTDSGRDVIEVAQMKGENRKTLISGMIDEPHAIVVDPLRGWARVLGGGVWAGVIHRGQRPQASRLLGPGPPQATAGDSQLNGSPLIDCHMQPRSGPPSWRAALPL